MNAFMNLKNTKDCGGSGRMCPKRSGLLQYYS